MKSRWATLLAGLSLSLAATLGAAAASANTLFQKGVAAWQAGHYQDAARAFRDAVAAQPASGTLLNLGLAEWRDGQVGEAVLSWQRALWVDPFNQAARNNLRFAGQIADLDPPDLAWYEVASTWLPASVWAWLAGGSLWLAVGMITLPGILRWRKAGWHQGLAAIGLGAFLLCIPAHVGILTRSHLGVVLDKNASLRLTPTLDAEKVSSLTAGESAREMRARRNYLLIRTQHGTGWVERKQFGLICPSAK